MNTKTRYTPGESIGERIFTHRYYLANGTLYLTVPGSYQSPISLGEISESISSQSSPGRLVNECLHEVLDVKVKELAVDRFDYGGTDYVLVEGDSTVWDLLQWGPPVIGDSYNVTFPKTTDQLLEEARQAFFDVNETDNLLNILEAGQTISSLVTLGAQLQRLKDNTGTIFDLWRSNAPSRHRFSARDVSNAYLAWSFGFAPLIADARRVASHLPRLRKNLLQLARNSAKPHAVTRRCYGVLDSVSYPTNGYLVPGQAPQPWAWWNYNQVDVVMPVRIAGVFGQRAVSYKTDEFQILDYLLSRYIATGPISLAWEKVKFSFAVDWFVNLTGVIDKMDNALTGNAKNITRAWTSEKLHTRFDTTFRGGGQSASIRFPSLVDTVIASRDIRKYHRKPAVLDYSVKYSGRFGKNQGYLSAALLHQYVANLVRR